MIGAIAGIIVLLATLASIIHSIWEDGIWEVMGAMGLGFGIMLTTGTILWIAWQLFLNL